MRPGGGADFVRAAVAGAGAGVPGRGQWDSAWVCALRPRPSIWAGAGSARRKNGAFESRQLLDDEERLTAKTLT